MNNHYSLPILLKINIIILLVKINNLKHIFQCILIIIYENNVNQNNISFLRTLITNSLIVIILML